MPRARVVSPVALAAALRVPVPSLHDLVRQLSHVDVERAFQLIVRQYLPDQYDTIMDAGKRVRGRGYDNSESARIYAFTSAFSDRYFPLMEWDETEYITGLIPFQRMGWHYDEFHEVDELRQSTQLLLLLVEDPYSVGGVLDGVRVVMMEHLEPLLGKELLQRLPPPMDPEALHERLDDTAFKPVAEFADWVWSSTGTAFLDLDNEMEVYDAEWQPSIVQELTQQWRTAEQILERIKAVELWLEASPKAHFSMLLDALLANAPPPKPEPSGLLIDILANPEQEEALRAEYENETAELRRLALPAGVAD